MTLVTFQVLAVANDMLPTITKSGFDQVPTDRRTQAFAVETQN